MGSFSNDLQIFNLLLGESAGSGYANWGEATNDNLLKIESALTATTDVTITTANVTLTDDQIKCLRLNLSGTKTAARSLIFPTRKRLYFVRNGTGGSFDLTAKCSGQPGVVVPRGVDILYCDGTDMLSLLTGSNNAVLNSGNLPTAPAGYINVFCRDDAGTYGYARIDKSTGAVVNVTPL